MPPGSRGKNGTLSLLNYDLAQKGAACVPLLALHLLFGLHGRDNLELVYQSRSVSSVELRCGSPPLPADAAELSRLVEITIHEPAGRKPHIVVVETSCNCEEDGAAVRRIKSSVLFTATQIASRSLVNVNVALPDLLIIHWLAHHSHLYKNSQPQQASNPTQ